MVGLRNCSIFVAQNLVTERNKLKANFCRKVISSANLGNILKLLQKKMYPMVARVGQEVLIVFLALTTSGTPADIAYPGGKFLNILAYSFN